MQNHTLKLRIIIVYLRLYSSSKLITLPLLDMINNWITSSHNTLSVDRNHYNVCAFLKTVCTKLGVDLGFMARRNHPVETSVVFVLTLPLNAMRPFPPI